MRKRDEKELRRLEQALLEEEAMQEDSEYIPESDWQQDDDLDYEIYNTDDTDVDLAEYSEEVYRERSGNGVAVLVTMLCMVIICVLILVLLKYLGVL